MQYTIHDVLKEIRLKALSERQKGTDFEKIMKRWFLTDPRYSNLSQVWLWEEFPGKSDFGGRDLGIDLVAKTELGDYWAIQCKCYAEDAVINRAAINSFISNASRTFINEQTLQTVGFSNLIWVSTTRKSWGPNAEEIIHNQSIPFNRINLFELETSTVDWRKIVDGASGEDALQSGRTPFAHQLDAISKAHKYFSEDNHDRGKLIMACGTGKTYTSLKILEKLTAKDSLCLILVPSIALLNQTLNAWMSDKEDDMRAICVCSDPKATRKIRRNNDSSDDSVVDLAVPATTNIQSIIRQIEKYSEEKKRVVIMSTYQSIDCVSEALLTLKKEVELCICDEAHRTTGVKIKGEDESDFIKVHDNKIIPAHKRLYMTATPRLYRECVKVKVKERDDILCSMDDEKIYGYEFYRLTFNDAVSKGLLSDYKVLVLTVSEDDLTKDISDNIKNRYNEAAESGLNTLRELNFDDATKLLGCVNGLSKRIKGDNGATWEQDPVVMRRAVAFCQTINPTQANPNASSTQISRYFSMVSDSYKNSLSEQEADKVVNVKAQHIDGTMDANTRNEKIAWLKEESADPNECRVLCNVRCLSEGVDVPALDAVLFLSPRNSEVEVVQSVGRVMRTFAKGTAKEKKYGYIIIPIIVPENVTPEEALNDNERFKVVWTILNALRSHDENFNAHINQINLNKKNSSKIVVAGVPKDIYSAGQGGCGGDSSAIQMDSEEVARQLAIRFGNLQNGIYARLVEKVGDKMYWENWSKDIGQIALKFIERIKNLITDNEEAKTKFGVFIDGLKKNINPSVDTGQAIEMLAQHMITKPVFDALFKDYEFVKNNIISQSMQAMIEVLESQGFAMDTEILDRFYTSVRNNVGNIDNLEGKQTIIKNLYEKFFKGAFPLTVEKLGIVYTPVECVDFIIRSVDEILKNEFNTALTNENVHILDPFTGTGTFISRLLQLGVINKEDIIRKYQKEIHCNELVLLAYYIADVNIESVYHDIVSPDKYEPYNGICLTDTFQLTEDDHNQLFTEYFQDNSERVKKLKETPVRVIIGNPPYSVGQKSADDDAQNLYYPKLEAKVADTYAAKSNANLKKALYDSYVKAFRWASDRIPQDEGGIVAFISNGSWLDSNATDGMRRCFEKEFSSIYVLNLRGNQRTSGELSRREGGKIFGGGSRTPITITFLVKNPAKKESKAQIFYHDIGNYLSREEKLKLIKGFRSIQNITWSQLTPNDKADWISQRDGDFDELLPLIPSEKFSLSNKSFFSIYSLGIATNKDGFVYNSSKPQLISTVQRMIEYYNSERAKLHQPSNYQLSVNSEKIVWTDLFIKAAENDVEFSLDNNALTTALYRPYFKQNFCFQKELLQRTAQQKKYFPNENAENIVICVSGVGVTKPFSCIITNTIPDLELIGKSQCFPLYWYEKNTQIQGSLFDEPIKDEYIRRDGISDWIVAEANKRYINQITRKCPIKKEHIFYYVYGILHSNDYRIRFENDLKKSLPRIPLVERFDDFLCFSSYGRKLAELHLKYESIAAYPDVVVSGDREVGANPTEEDYNYFRIPDKMRFAGKTDKSTITYNGNIKISNIPDKAYEYIVNGKSAIDWIVERYCISKDKKSLIVNDCNAWSREHNKPRYILDLLLSVINVSVQSVDIINSLPRINFDEE